MSPSQLRLQTPFEPTPAQAIYQPSPTLPAAKKQKMSLTQTYYVASTARSKLGREAGKADHNLRLLVGHANLLDSLMVELTDAEREQENWFNQSVRKASKPEQPKHIQWVDAITEEDEDDMMEDDSDADSDDSDLDEDMDIFSMPLRKIRSPPVTISSAEIDEDIEEDDDEPEEYYDEEDDDAHALERVASQHSPPELLQDSDSESEDESMPPSPESASMELDDKQRQAITTTSFYDAKSQQGLEDYIMRQREPAIAVA